VSVSVKEAVLREAVVGRGCLQGGWPCSGAYVEGCGLPVPFSATITTALVVGSR